MSDPWKHRSSTMKCVTCMWFVEKVVPPTLAEQFEGLEAGSVSAAPIQEVRAVFGRCRKRAPTMNGYPAVFGADWCGDHKLDENKI